MAEDYIKRSNAINALKGLPTWWADQGGIYGNAQPPMEAMLDPEDTIWAIENIPSADVVDLNDLEKGCFYGVGTDGVFYKLYPRIKLPLAKKINVETGEIIYPTNADRFRAKSDEELAKTLSGEEIYPWCKESCKYINCYDCILAWLKQEAET